MLKTTPASYPPVEVGVGFEDDSGAKLYGCVLSSCWGQFVVVVCLTPCSVFL
jgi:hypothetical protein